MAACDTYSEAKALSAALDVCGKSFSQLLTSTAGSTGEEHTKQDHDEL